MTTTDRSPLNVDQLVRDRARAIELLLALCWNTTSNEVDDPYWRAAKRWLEGQGAWENPNK